MRRDRAFERDFLRSQSRFKRDGLTSRRVLLAEIPGLGAEQVPSRGIGLRRSGKFSHDRVNYAGAAATWRLEPCALIRRADVLGCTGAASPSVHLAAEDTRIHASTRSSHASKHFENTMLHVENGENTVGGYANKNPLRATLFGYENSFTPLKYLKIIAHEHVH